MRKMSNKLCLAVALTTAALLPGTAFAASTINGTITFAGAPPKLPALKMDADPACAKKHSGPVASEMLIHSFPSRRSSDLKHRGFWCDV